MQVLLMLGGFLLAQSMLLVQDDNPFLCLLIFHTDPDHVCSMVSLNVKISKFSAVAWKAVFLLQCLLDYSS